MPARGTRLAVHRRDGDLPGIVNTGITSTARFAGVDAEEEARRRKNSARLYGLRNYPPEKVASAVLDAIADNKPLVPVTPESRVAHALSRVLPGALRRLARVEPKV